MALEFLARVLRQIVKEEIKSFLFIDDMILYAETLKILQEKNP